MKNILLDCNFFCVYFEKTLVFCIFADDLEGYLKYKKKENIYFFR